MTAMLPFTGFNTDDPHEVLTEVTDVLEAVVMIFMGDDGTDLNKRASSGLHHILATSIRGLQAAEGLVAHQISDPMQAGFQQAAESARGEYSRGVREGREALLRALEPISPDLARTLRARGE